MLDGVLNFHIRVLRSVSGNAEYWIGGQMYVDPTVLGDLPVCLNGLHSKPMLS